MGSTSAIFSTLVTDAYSRKIVGYHLSDDLNAESVVSNMFCEDQESTLFKLLDGKSKLALKGDELTFSQNGKTTLVFTRAQPLSATDLAGVWKLQSINGNQENADTGIQFRRKKAFRKCRM